MKNNYESSASLYLRIALAILRDCRVALLLATTAFVLNPVFALDGKVEDVRGAHSELQRDKKVSTLQKGLALYENDTVRNGEATISKLSLSMKKLHLHQWL